MKLADIEARFYELVTARDSVAVRVAEGGPEVRHAVEPLLHHGIQFECQKNLYP